MPLTSSISAVQAALDFEPNGWLFAPHPVSVDGSASEYPFVLTWFMDGPSDSMEHGPSDEQMEDEDEPYDDEVLTSYDIYMEGFY